MAVVVNPVVCVWVDVVAVVTLYPLLAITVLTLLSLVFWVGAFLTLWLMLGWTSHDCAGCWWFCVELVWHWGLNFGPSLPSNSR